jgi:tRNA(Ile)-lysidine synthase
MVTAESKTAQVPGILYTGIKHMSLADSVTQTLHQLIPSGSKLVVGVSGGADSLTLLHVLSRLPPESALDLHVATFDHGLREKAGADDVRFVIQTCEAWGIPVTAGSRSDLPYSENAARTARYDFLAQVAHQTQARYVAVAHHAGDQAETVLMHLIRGAGLQGISGMALSGPLPGHPELTLIRPLLNTTRAEIDAYCREHRLKPRLDYTNQDMRLLRNRLRLETLPHLRQLNPHIEQALNRFAAIAARDQAFIQQQLQQAIRDHVQVSAQRVSLPRKTFSQLHPALQYHFVLWATYQIGGQDVGAEHVARAVELALRGHTGQRALLPGKLHLRLDYKIVIIEQSNVPQVFAGPLLPPGASVPVSVPGITPLPQSEWRLQTSRMPLGEAQAALVVDESQTIELRTRRPGDRFAPPGLDGHTQKLKDWLIDHTIPRAMRDQIPLLTIDGEIAALIIGGRWVINPLFAIQNVHQSIIYFRFA